MQAGAGSRRVGYSVFSASLKMGGAVTARKRRRCSKQPWQMSARVARGAAPGRSQRLGLHFPPDADKDPDTNQSQVQEGARKAAINHHMGYIPTIPHEL